MLALCPVLAFTFAFLFWGSMDTVVRNYGIIAISPMDVIIPLIVMFVVGFVLIFCVFIFVRGLVFDVLASTLLAITVAGYAQIAFLNRDIGLLDGEGFNFSTIQIAINLLIWVLIFVSALVLRFIAKDIWKKSIIFGSLLIFLMQLGAFASAIPIIMSSEKRSFNTDYILSLENEFELSLNENTLIFVLDSMSVTRLNAALSEFPHLQYTFRDFTSFENSSTVFDATFPTMAFLLTNQHFDFTRPTREYLANVWMNPETLSFYDALHDLGYRFHLYTSPGQIALEQYQLSSIVDNLVYSDLGEVYVPTLIREMIGLSAFRHAPLVLKEPLSPTDGSFYNTIRGFQGYSFTAYNDIELYGRLIEEGLSTQSNYNMLIINHMRGSHRGAGGGVNMDEFANYNPDLDVDERHRQTAGALWIVGEYMNQMRRLGIYDNANIIVMADHGYGLSPVSAFMIKRANAQNDTMKVSQAPISHVDLWPTLVDIMSLDIELNSGRSVFDVDENEVRERVVNYWFWYDDFPNSHLTYNAIATLTMKGHVSDEIYRVRGGRRQTPGFSERFPHIQIIPVYDSYYGGGWERE